MAITDKVKKLKTSVMVRNTGPYLLAEPLTGQPFPSEEDTETTEITPWIQAQIDAGLFIEIGPAPAPAAE